ncbi:MAG: alpha/beta hydrolase [Gordonia sp. (in: high G+C Gram-positive bacteria)]|uniref:alpha/beta hydrolase n=1 Tax=Gordonia sp. (in: high G+C Gram-positive bacteria) TaxID=84139 RepID=UPI0039E3FAE6
MKRILTSGWLWWALSALVFVLATLVFVLQVTPTPGAVLTRQVFDKGGAAMHERNAEYADKNVQVTSNISYAPADSPVAGKYPADTMLDVYRAPGATGPAPTIVWIHGGGWVSGDKTDMAHYLTRLAGAGFTVLSLNYSLAPDRRYPLAVKQLSEGLRFAVDHAADYGVDPGKIVLAGDSAGANLASQLAALITNPEFAQRVGVTPGIGASSLRGALLNCGVYDAFTLGPKDHPHSAIARIFSWGVNNTLWAYTGSRELPSAAADQMSTIKHITGQYPPTWVSAGNADALTPTQSIPFVAALKEKGVDVSTLIYDKSEPAQLQHEFQFELATPQAQRALAESIDFVRRVTG